MSDQSTAKLSPLTCRVISDLDTHEEWVISYVGDGIYSCGNTPLKYCLEYREDGKTFRDGSHIKIRGYHGTPFTLYEQGLLQQKIKLCENRMLEVSRVKERARRMAENMAFLGRIFPDLEDPLGQGSVTEKTTEASDRKITPEL